MGVKKFGNQILNIDRFIGKILNGSKLNNVLREFATATLERNFLEMFTENELCLFTKKSLLTREYFVSLRFSPELLISHSRFTIAEVKL